MMTYRFCKNILLLSLTSLLFTPVTSICSVPKSTNVVVYSATGWGGVGEYSDIWTRAFFAWFSAAQVPSSPLEVAFVTDATELSTYYTDGCKLSDSNAFPSLVLYVHPGGSADNASTSLGPGGRDNILDFAASLNGHLMATCAGFYYLAGTYWWKDTFYPEAWMPHLFPTVEGDITAIATYPNYAPTTLDDGRTVIYWGGPTLGLNHTGASLPFPTSKLLASFNAQSLPHTLPAAIQYNGQYVRALLNSPHPEAQSGVGLSCSAPLPPGCITLKQQLENWIWLAKEINALTGQEWIIPTKL